MGAPDFDADAYNVTAQFLAVSKKGDAVRARALLARGAAPNARNRNGETALLMFTKRGDAAMIELLLQRGVDVNLAAIDGTTPLMAAAFEGHVAIATRLLDAGADVDVLDRLEKNAMIYAAGAGRSRIVALLLDRGIDPDRAYEHDLTALMWAAGYGRTDTGRCCSRGAPTLRGGTIEDSTPRRSQPVPGMKRRVASSKPGGAESGVGGKTDRYADRRSGGLEDARSSHLAGAGNTAP